MVKAALLAISGFVLATLGLSAYYTGTLGNVFSGGGFAQGNDTLAHACIPDAKEESEEIFFLSCGGIF